MLTLITVIGLLVLMGSILVLMDLGRIYAARQRIRLDKDSLPDVTAVDGAVFGMLGLLLAFTFSNAASRFDMRRQLVIDEANNIGTAYLRLDLLPASAQPELRENFRRYVDSRLETYRKMTDFEAAKAEYTRSQELQGVIWQQAVKACGESNSGPATMLLMPAINSMIDITTTRFMAAQFHPPATVFAMLFILVLAGAFLAGYSMESGKYRDWIHMLCFAAVMSAAVYVIIDYEFPRLGLIRIDAFDQVLVDVRASMK